MHSWPVPSSTPVRVLIALSVCVAFLALPALSSAAPITVDSTADEVDLAPGGGCVTAGGNCTLRAAIEEANAASGTTIAFDPTVFDGSATSTIEVASQLPVIVNPTRIDGGQCVTEVGVNGPCIALRRQELGPGLRLVEPTVVIDGDEVEIENIDVISASTAIEVSGASDFTIAGNWFGVALDGEIGLYASDGTAVEVVDGAEEGQIGGKEAGRGNLFASVSEGVDIYGASRVRILGNRFGATPTGEAFNAQGSAKAIRVRSEPHGHEALGNVIGTRLSATALETAACDGGCNEIGHTERTLAIGGTNADEAPRETIIRGNYLGLDGTGSARIPGINRASLAASSRLGGPAAGDANWIEGPVDSGPETLIEGNWIGVDFFGAGPIASAGIGIWAEEISDASEESVVAGNVIEVASGRGIDVNGGAVVLENEIVGAQIGIHLGDKNEGASSVIEGNWIEDSGTGIMIENDFNEVFGNAIFGTEFGGIEIIGRNGIAATGNLIGGDSAASENFISFTQGHAVVIAGVEGSENEVARNSGGENEGGYIHLWNQYPHSEPFGPNDGIARPTFEGASASGASGEALPGAKVRVFKKASPEPGELESFVAETVAGPDGHWAVTFTAPLAEHTYLAASQTNDAGGTSELAFSLTPDSPKASPPTATTPSPTTTTPSPATRAPSHTPRPITKHVVPGSSLRRDQQRRAAGGEYGFSSAQTRKARPLNADSTASPLRLVPRPRSTGKLDAESMSSGCEQSAPAVA